MGIELKNPFGIRGDNIVLIEDIGEEERGLNCDCTCPSCGGEFIAKLGMIKRHHFAHNGAGCDAVKAFLVGMYTMLDKHLKNKGTIFLPPVIVGFELSGYGYITDYNIANKTQLLSRSVNRKAEIVVANGVEKAFFDRSEIIYDTKGYPTAIIVEKNSRNLAIRIVPPATVCQEWRAHPYKDMATLSLSMDKYFERLYTDKIDNLLSDIENDTQIAEWVQNKLIEKAYENVKKRSKEYYIAAKEYRAAMQKRRVKQENSKFNVNIPVTPRIPYIRNKSSDVKEQEIKTIESNNSTVDEIDRETRYRIGYGDIRYKFNSKTKQDTAIIDRFGTRWVQCERCGKVAQEGEFACYGGEKHVNLGICRKCTRGK